MKIYIMGSTGVGKTYLSKKISNKYNIKTYELDKIVYDQEVQTIQNFHFDSFDNIYRAIKANDPNYGKIVDESIEKTNFYVKKLIRKK